MHLPPVVLQANCVPEEHFYVDTYPCPCGAGGYQMYEQRVVEATDGKQVDVLNARSRTCGATHEFAFDLTHAFGKLFPEIPSQLFDLYEWAGLLVHLGSKIPQNGNVENPVIVMNALVAVEQALLFFDPGEDTPRADAFFHTRNVPEEIRPLLVRSRLAGVQQRLRSLCEYAP